MADRLSPGIQNNTPEGLARRIAVIERFLGVFLKQVVIARDVFGQYFKFDVLAVRGGKADGPSDGEATAGAFYTMRTVSGGVDDGDIYLQGGFVTAGTGNAEVNEFKVFDASSAAWSGSAGEVLQIAVNGDGQVTSGILDPVFNLTDTTIIPTVVATLDPNTLPTASSAAGKVCNISLGTFFDGGFQPTAAGTIIVGFCWGGFSHNH